MLNRATPVEYLQALALAERAADPLNALETFMADDTKKTGLDRKLISLDEPHEVRSWCESMGCTEAQLREAVHAAVSSASAVRDYLQKSGNNS